LVWPSATTAKLLIGAGLACGAAHIVMTLSFRHADVSAMVPFEYLSILWAVVLGFVVFTEVPGLTFRLTGPVILTRAINARPARPR
jgi:drug/metabolite transporter (DMT)-like permease